MKHILTLALLFLAFIANAQSTKSIRDIDGLVAWFSADSAHLTNDGHVDILYDKSGNGHNAVQSVAAKQPTWVAADETINNQPTLSFDGGDYLVSNFGEMVSQPNTVFVIWKSTTESTGYRMCYSGVTGGYRNQLYTAQNQMGILAETELKTSYSSMFDYTVFQTEFNGTSSKLFANNHQLGSGNAGSLGPKGVTIGAFPTGAYGIVGNITEFIFVNGILSSADSSIIMDYFRNKYAPVLTLDNVTSSYGFAPIEIDVSKPWFKAYVWSDGNKNTVRTFNSSGIYSLEVTDLFGYTTIDSLTVSLGGAYVLPDTTICLGDTIVWSPKLVGPYTYKWSNGSTESQIRISKSGQYSVEVTDTLGFVWNSKVVNVVVDSFPKKKLFDGDVILCSGDSVSVSNIPSNEYAFVWSNGSEEPKIPIFKSGKYSLMVTNAKGCSVRDTFQVIIRGVKPTAKFLTNDVVCDSATVFSNVSYTNDGSQVVSCKWNFGDNKTSQVFNPIHTYSGAGTYLATLLITTNANCSDSYSTPASVKVNPAHKVTLVSPTARQQCYSNKVHFAWQPIQGCTLYHIQVATDSLFNSLVVDAEVCMVDTTVQLVIDGKYWWRVKTEVGDYCRPFMISLNTIKNIPGLVAWYSADSVHISSGSSVDILYDKSGNGYNAVQSVVIKQPAWIAADETINNQPTLSFDGGDYLVSNFGEVVSQPNTVFVIWKSTTESTGYRMCYSGVTGGYRNQLYTAQNQMGILAETELKTSYSSMFDYTVFQTEFNGTSSKLFANNHQLVSGNAGSLGPKGVTIGAFPTGAYGIVGNITEFIFVNGILSSADSSIIMDYFRDKYTMKVSLFDIVSTYGFKPVEVNAFKPGLYNFSWGDGGTDPIRTITKSGFYKVAATDIFGFSTFDSTYITVVEPNVISDTLICLGDTITWNPNLEGPYSYAWSNGSTAATLDISSEGNYWVVITDTAGYSWHSDTITVTVDSFPVQATLGPDTIRACVGNYIYLANGYESATSYLWSTGDTTNHFEIFESGLYSVSVVNNLGCRAIDTAYYHVEGIAPTVNFSYDSLCQTRNIKFTNLSHSNDESPIATFNWSFGNGDTSFQSNPYYTYQSSGQYEVKLTVECQNGCANEVRKSLTVWQLPTADFVPDAVCSNTETQLFSRSKSPDDTISLWQWTIGGIGYSEVNPKLQFADAGKVGVTLAVATAHGCTDTISKTIVVRKGPQADFNVGPVCVDAPISLTNATINYLNLAVDYKWEIDDTDFSNMRNAELVLNDTEPHKVVMTVRQHSNGCESSVHKTLQAKSRPNVGFDVNDVCANSLPKLIAAQGNNVEQLDCVWTIDTLPKIFGKSAQLINLKEGPHAITLVATDEVGCHDTASAIFNVLPDVQATFVADVAEGAVPLVVTFKNTTTQNSEFNWDFGDGYFATERNVQHTFADSGVFNVTLTSTTPNGCVTKAEKQISTRVAHSNLAIALAKANVVTDYIEIEATLINKGTVDEHNVLINCTNNLGLDITEALPDTIFAHKVYQHKLNARLNSRDLQNLEFVCLSIKSDNTDEDETDNEFCISFTDNRFVVLQPKPNPATDHVNIEFVTQDGGNAQLAVYNANGKQIMSKEVVAESGIMRIKIDVSTLPAGNYVCMLRHNGHVSKQMFVVMRGK